MLEKIDLSKRLKRKECKEQFEAMEVKLSHLQRDAKALGIPVMLVFEGWDAAGKGTLINQLIQPLDPRGFKVYTIQGETEDEKLHPFLWRFWTKTPAKGRIHIFDRSWYRRVLRERQEQHTGTGQLQKEYNDIVNFEEQLSVDGTLIIKFFLHISQKEQEKRFKKLEDSKETSWRVSKDDWKHNKAYDQYLEIYDEMLEKTDMEFAPWTIVEATDKEYAILKIMTVTAARLEEKIAELKKQAALKEANNAKSAKNAKKPREEAEVVEEVPTDTSAFRNGVLASADLTLALTKDEYKKKLKELQAELGVLHSALYRKRIPVVLGFEGWDAGGKGGAIKRLTQCMDPRGYEVCPTAAPNDIEKVHHYLWRFWNNMPKAGHVAIFDRTWYGRVMVERIEGFCAPEDWKRAYKEINQMEEQLTNAGAIVIKFWMQIDKDEQEKRFKERMADPEKQWKITDEDWRNREKWDQYVEAVDEMIVRTSTSHAPWVIVEGNCKYYARIKVLETVIAAIKERLKKA